MEFAEVNESFRTLIAFEIFSALLCVLTLLSTSYDCFMSHMKKEPVSPLLLTFSLRKNFKILINTRDDKNSIGSIHGVRCYAIISMMLLHWAYYRAQSPFMDRKVLLDFSFSIPGEIFAKCATAVDCFFVISGALLARSSLRNLENKSFNNAKIILQRFFSITPCLAFAILFNDVATRLAIKNDEDLATLNDSVINCWSYWWRSIFHIQNYFKATELCLAPSWFLNVDFQMFLVSPALIYLLWKFKGKFLVVIYGLIFGSTIVAFLIAYDLKLNYNDYHFANQGLDLPEGNLLYLPTHIRGMPFLVGILLGYYIYTKENSENPKGEEWTVLRILFTCFSLYILSTPVTTLRDDPGKDRIYNASILSFGRLFWAFSTAWLIYSCQIGFNKLINSFLSYKLWIPFGRMGLSIYLIHPIIYRLIANRQREKVSFETDPLSLSVEIFVVLGVSTMFYLVVQEPVNQLTKYSMDRIFRVKKEKTAL